MMLAMNHAVALAAILSADPSRRRGVELVHALALPDCWIEAGFIRNAVWDRLHGRPVSDIAGDVDVIWFHPTQKDPTRDQNLEAALRTAQPAIR